ncbi:MAG: DUF721 domain-containing protein [Planctomycetes bacterium]|nr:DUF721 domain-containing protein [Planctomycetota bacterium]
MQAQESRRSAEPTSFGEIARRILRHKKLYQKSRVGPLMDTWRELLGESVAARTSIYSFEKGELVVSVDSAALLSEMDGFMRERLVVALQATEAGRDVASLRFRLSQGPPREDGKQL